MARIRRTMATVLFVVISAFFCASIEADGSVSLADFDWDIVRKAGFPLFSFANATQHEVIFKYSVSGAPEDDTYGDIKYLHASVFTSDCISTGNLPAILIQQELSDTDEYTVALDIIQEFISDSNYYVQTNPTNATINFCIRLDYMFVPPDGSETRSINFHETNVTVSVDLTAGFSLTEGMSVDRSAAGQETITVELDYPVTAYFCNSDSVAVPAPVLSQGSAMQFCVERDGSDTTDTVYVSDILIANLDQSGGVHTNLITATVPDALTSKNCTAGICNIQSQLMSKWFAENDPDSIDISGTALLAFGTVPGGRRRYMRVAFGGSAQAQAQEQQQQQERDLQGLQTLTDPIESLMGDFGLTVDLEGDAAEDDNRMGMIIICVVVSVVVTILCCLLACCCRRKKVITTTTIHEHMVGEHAYHSPPPPTTIMHMHLPHMHLPHMQMPQMQMPHMHQPQMPPPPPPPILRRQLPRVAPAPHPMRPPANSASTIVTHASTAAGESMRPPPAQPPPTPSYRHQSAQIYPAPTIVRQPVSLYPASTYNHHGDDSDVIIEQDHPAVTRNHHDDDDDVIIEQDHASASTTSTQSHDASASTTSTQSHATSSNTTSTQSHVSSDNGHGDDDEVIILVGTRPVQGVDSKRKRRAQPNNSRKSSQHRDASTAGRSDDIKSHGRNASKNQTETTPWSFGRSDASKKKTETAPWSFGQSDGIMSHHRDASKKQTETAPWSFGQSDDTKSHHRDASKKQTETTPRSFGTTDGTKLQSRNASKKRDETTIVQCQYVD